MVFKHRNIFFITFLLVSFYSDAQISVNKPVSTNLRYKVLKVEADSVCFDTLSIVPQTFQINGI
ncbi:MAG: hypothetical protein WBC06_17910, partial [Chitinophagaceae bacterium]